MRRNRRGSVLVHVLITSVVVSIIAAGLMKMLMMRAVLTNRASQGNATAKMADKGFNRLMTFWNKPGNGVCSSGGGYTCTGTAGTCGCTCSPGVGTDATIVTAIDGNGNCRVTVTAPEAN